MKPRFAPALLAAVLAGCAASPQPPAPPPQRYHGAWMDFQTETDAMLRNAGRNRLRVEGSAGRARSALETMKGLLAPEPAVRVGEIEARYAGLARTIVADGALSSGQERAVTALRDEVVRDFAPEKVSLVVTEAPPPEPAPLDAFAKWEASHRAFVEHAKGGESARVVQDYSDLRSAMEGFSRSDDDRLRVERFLREYERIAELVERGQALERDLKGLSVLEADVRASFGEKR